MANQTILVVDDEELVRWSLKERLGQEGYQVREAGTVAEARRLFSRGQDLVLLDVRLPDGDGVTLLEEFKEKEPDLPVVLMTAHGTVENAVLAMRAGAYDYISKPFSMEEMLLVLSRALEAVHLRREVNRIRKENRKRFGVDRILGVSPAMVELRSLVRRVAASQSATVLVRGESGVGKGLVAQALHYESDRASFPFTNITCTALSETLLESELFGHEKGAFTDARAAKRGLLEVADKGTVFLDEVGDMPISVQGKLLRFLEDRVFRKVGGLKDIEVDVRVVAATNKDLEKEVERGRFREDLYYRLKVIPLEIPPLRERPEDTEVLAREFVGQFGREFKKPAAALSREALELIRTYPWPGNVRELRNAIERAVLLGAGDLILPEDLPEEIARLARAGGAGDGEGREDRILLPPGGISLEDLERGLVLQALERTEWNMTRAGKLLGLNRDQVRYRAEKYGLSRKGGGEKGTDPGGGPGAGKV